MHDDALVDMNVLSQGVFPFPTESIIGNTLGKSFEDLSYKDPRVEPDEQAARFAYRIYPNGTYANHNMARNFTVRSVNCSTKRNRLPIAGLELGY
jgi:hypothetical protein